MKFTQFKRALAGAAVALGLASGSAMASGGTGLELKHAQWSWNGVFGKFDQAQLKRGLQVYREICSSCHGLNLVAYRNLADLGFTEDEIKDIAAEYEVQDGPDEYGEMFMREARPADHFVKPFPNDNAAKFANGGALPPDLSLITKARLGGEDYIYSFLLGFHDEPPEGVTIPEGKYYNDYFSGHAVSMPPQIYDDLVEYEDGTEATAEQIAQDTVAFLHWAAEPNLNARHSLGIKVMLYLLVLTAMLYALKRQIWARIKKK
jgi:cytochrome c1